MDNPRAEKVAVVTEVRRALRRRRGRRAHRVPRARRGRAGRAPQRPARRRWQLQDLQEHAGAPRRPRAWPRHRRPAHRPHGHRVRRTATSPAVAKALRDFAKANPALVVKGGLLGDAVLGAADVTALADLPSREQLLSEIAGLFAARCSSSPACSTPCPGASPTRSTPSSRPGGAPGAPPRPRRGPGPRRRRPPRRRTTTPAEDSATPEADTGRRHRPLRLTAGTDPGRVGRDRGELTMATLTTDDILDAIAGMTVLELSELKKAFEESFGVTAAAPVAVAAAAPAGGAGDAGAAEEQDEFDVVLTGAGEKKIERHQGGPLASPASGSRRPRTSWTAPPSPSSRRPPRRTPRRPRRPSRPRARRSSSSSRPLAEQRSHGRVHGRPSSGPAPRAGTAARLVIGAMRRPHRSGPQRCAGRPMCRPRSGAHPGPGPTVGPHPRRSSRVRSPLPHVRRPGPAHHPPPRRPRPDRLGHRAHLVCWCGAPVVQDIQRVGAAAEPSRSRASGAGPRRSRRWPGGLGRCGPDPVPQLISPVRPPVGDQVVPEAGRPP